MNLSSVALEYSKLNFFTGEFRSKLSPQGCEVLYECHAMPRHWGCTDTHRGA